MVDEVGRDVDGDGGGAGVEGVVDELLDGGGGVGEGERGTEGADGGGGEGADGGGREEGFEGG